MSTNVVELNDSDKAILKVDAVEEERIGLDQNMIYLRIDCDFSQHRDLATFYYSLDNRKWIKVGQDFKMKFDFTKFFMGTKFAIFNYATKTKGGYVDIDFFHYKKKKVEM